MRLLTTLALIVLALPASGSEPPPLRQPPTVKGRAAKAEPAPQPAAVPAAVLQNDGLDEVNAKRAARGLRPFLRDDALTSAAHAAATFRARYLLFGHTADDFAFLPAGARADSAGCAAYPAEYGWLSCCTYENYTHAGAAYSIGSDGKRYMHLYVRSGGPATPAAPVQVAADEPVRSGGYILRRHWDGAKWNQWWELEGGVVASPIAPAAPYCPPGGT